jgi:hypothetical protein
LETGVLFLEIDELGWDIVAREELFVIGWRECKVEVEAFWDGVLVWGKGGWVNSAMLSRGGIVIVVVAMGAMWKAVKLGKGSTGM